jgi:hypothetical protein
MDNRCSSFFALCGTLFLIAEAFGIFIPAQAGPLTVPFSGTVASKCVFGVPRLGILAVGAHPNQLEASAGFGSVGSVEISCNTAATVTVSDPVDSGSTGGTNFNSPYYGSYIQSGVKIANSPIARVNHWPIASAQTSIPITAGAMNVPINVGMVRRTNDLAIQSGSYTYKVTITSTP